MIGTDCVKVAIVALRLSESDIKAIVSSEYSSDHVMADYQKYEFLSLLAKPSHIQEVGVVLQKLL
jgi:hypothetical protein